MGLPAQGQKQVKIKGKGKKTRMMARKDFVAVHFPVLDLRMEGCVGEGRGGGGGKEGDALLLEVGVVVGVNYQVTGRSRKRETTKFPMTKMFMRHKMRQNTEGGA